MLLTDYFYSEPDAAWSLALQCGVTHGAIRLPDDPDYDFTDLSALKAIADRFKSHGITPVVLEPLPNQLHDHIKTGDALRDEAIDKFIKLMSNLHMVGINTVCFNFMAHYGWTRTDTMLPERGGATVTGFSLDRFSPDEYMLERDRLFYNYEYFIKAVIPYAERYDIRLALHPDDPPLEGLGNVARIFTSLDAIKRGVGVVSSPNLGVTFCQACYHLMGERLDEAISELADKIFFVHFRNVRGIKTNFAETFHDNGDIDMAAAMKLYIENGVDAPIRVDHVPTLAGEDSNVSGYDTLGRLFAIGYLKGILDGLNAARPI